MRFLLISNTNNVSLSYLSSFNVIYYCHLIELLKEIYFYVWNTSGRRVEAYIYEISLNMTVNYEKREK